MVPTATLATEKGEHATFEGVLHALKIVSRVYQEKK